MRRWAESGVVMRWLVMLAGALLAILLQGVAVPNNANAYHWPIVLDWLRTAEGPHDLFTQSLDNYLSHFYTVLGWIASEATMTTLFYLLHVAVMLAIVAALRRIYAALTGADGSRVTWAAAATPVVIHSFVDSPLGHGEVLLDSLSHSSAIVAFVLWGWALALEGRWLAAALVMGASFNVKTFTAAWGGLTLAGAALDGERRDGALLGRLLLLFLLFALAAVPTLLWLAERWDSLAAASATAFDFRDFLREFYPGHVMVGFATPGEQLLGALAIFAFPLLWLALRSGGPVIVWRRLLGLWLASLAIVFWGMVLPLLTANQLLLNMTPLRIDGFLAWLFFIALAVLVVRQPRWASLALAAAVAVLVARWPAVALLLLWQAVDAKPARVRNVAALVVLFAILVAASSALPLSPGAYDRFGGGLALAASLLALPFLAPRTGASVLRLPLLATLAALDYLWASGQSQPAPWPAALLILAFAAALLPQRLLQIAAGVIGAAALAWVLLESADRRALLLLPAALVPALGSALLQWRPSLARLAPLVAAGVVLLLLAQPLLHLAKTGRLDRYAEADLAFFDLQRWARQATAPDSLFLQPDAQLVPNLTPSFWTYARRPAWVDWRQGAAVHWLPDFYPLWHQRMAEVAALKDVAAKLAYAQAHDIPYVILAADEALPEGTPAPLYADAFWRVLPAR